MSELSRKVAREIMLRIVRQEFGEGQPFPHEIDLCEEYNVSRVVIREAKKQLQALGMLTSRKKYGSFISPSLGWNYFNRDLFDICIQHNEQAGSAMKDYFTFRKFVEPQLAEQVAREHSPEFADRLNSWVHEMENAYNSQEWERWLMADLAFHVEIYKESKNILVMPLANLLRPLFLRSFEAGRAVGELNIDLHQALAEAILDHDPQQALHYTHIIVHRGEKNFLKANASEG